MGPGRSSLPCSLPLSFPLTWGGAPCHSTFRFIPRHEDELELDVDDPILVELEEDDYWYRGYNMRTGERGIFPAFYAHEVVSPVKEGTGRPLAGGRGGRFAKRFSQLLEGSSRAGG